MTRREILSRIVEATRHSVGVMPTVGFCSPDDFRSLHGDGYTGTPDAIDYVMVAGVPIFRGADGLPLRFFRDLYHEARCGHGLVGMRDGVACADVDAAASAGGRNAG